MLFGYLASPFIGYIFGGGLKFVINVIKNKKIDFGFIGMGGMPSTHTSIATAPLTLCIYNNGINDPIVGVGVAFLLITIIDALDLRKKISNHASQLNKLLKTTKTKKLLKENINHNVFEILGGIFTGICAGFFTFFVFNYLVRL